MSTWFRPKILAVVMVAVLGTTGAAASLTGGDDDENVIYAEFTDAVSLLEGNDVKINGVTVGKTGEAQLDEERQMAVIPLHLDDVAFPIHEDATASINPVTLLGERYVKLDPGTDSKPALQSGDRIAASRTDVPVELQDVINSLDDPTASALSALVTTLGQGAGANGKNIQDAIRVLAPAMRDTDKLVRVLKDQNSLLGSVIDKFAPVASAMAADEGSRLDRLVGSSERLLAATASRNEQLAATLRELPATLRQARQTLGNLTGTSQATTEVLANMRPATDNLTDISRELIAFSDNADPALASADPVLDRANDLLDRARPVVQELRKAGPGLRRSSKGARPIVRDLNNNLGNVLSFIRYWALTTNGKDGLSHYFRAHFVLTPDAVSGFLPGGTENGTPDPSTKKEPRKRKNKPTSEGSPLPIPGGLLAPETDDSGGSTGLNQEQERGALGFLLGGL